MPTSTVCPRCHAAFLLADHLQGKKVRCTRCSHAFVAAGAADPAEEEAEAVQKEARRRPPIPALREEADEEDVVPRRRLRRQREEEEEEEEGPPRRPGRGGTNLRLVIGLAVGGAALVVLGGGLILALVWFRVVDDLGGTWPTPRPMVGFAPEQVVTLHIAGVADENTREAVLKKIAALADPGPRQATVSSGQGDRLTVLVAPAADPRAVAQKISFGSVRRVNGRVITVVAARAEGPPAAADPVAEALEGLKAANGFRRAEAARRLKEMVPEEGKRAEVARALRGLLNDPDVFVRDAVTEALGVWGGAEDVPALIKLLQGERRGRSGAIKALGRLKDERAAEPLAARLEEFFDRREAAEALKAIGPAAQKAVAGRLKHHDAGVRREACEVLKAIGTRESLPALEKLAGEKDPFVAPAAKEAIEAINRRSR